MVIQKFLAKSERKFQAKFASPNRYFTENSRWMPLTSTVKNNNRFIIAAQFLVHFLAVDLNDCNVKRPENFLVFTSWRKCGTCSCSLFPLPLIFFQLRHKIRICSVMGKLDLFENYKGFNIIDLEAIVPSLPQQVLHCCAVRSLSLNISMGNHMISSAIWNK